MLRDHARARAAREARTRLSGPPGCSRQRKRLLPPIARTFRMTARPPLGLSGVTGAAPEAGVAGIRISWTVYSLGLFFVGPSEFSYPRSIFLHSSLL